MSIVYFLLLSLRLFSSRIICLLFFCLFSNICRFY
nr:MAG TPA: hypothetical protein [Crassvirales sp.]DAP51505.1 MAG TPA: hypothetical protein [Caudoviricetes sp.]